MARQFAGQHGTLVPYRPPQPTTTPSITLPGSGNTDTLTIARSEFENRLAIFERNSTDPNASDLSEALRSIFLN